jgi:arylsulfatase B
VKLLLLTSLFHALIPLVGASANTPNIVIILTDDMGWKDVGYHGAEFPTPNIDRIAREGVELDQYYVTPLCSPTRAGLMTGRYPNGPKLRAV